MNANGTERLNGRVAIVTGGTGGIGRAAAAELLKEGARVALVARSLERIDEAIQQIGTEGNREGSKVLALALDVRSEADMESMVRRTVEAFGRVDILLTCAGLGGPTRDGRGGIPSPVAQMTPEDWDEVLDTNLKGVFLSNRAVVRAMAFQGRGDIINISSARGAVSGQPYAAAYCASKFGVMGLTEALAEEARGSGIRVQALLPDAIDTPLLAGTPLAPGPGEAISSVTLARFIVTMLTLPEDTLLVNPLIAPMRARKSRRRRPPATASSEQAAHE